MEGILTQQGILLHVQNSEDKIIYVVEGEYRMEVLVPEKAKSI